MGIVHYMNVTYGSVGMRGTGHLMRKRWQTAIMVISRHLYGEEGHLRVPFLGGSTVRIFFCDALQDLSCPLDINLSFVIPIFKRSFMHMHCFFVHH